MAKDVEEQFSVAKAGEAKEIILKQQMRISEACTENDALRKALIELQLKVAKTGSWLEANKDYINYAAREELKEILK